MPTKLLVTGVGICRWCFLSCEKKDKMGPREVQQAKATSDGGGGVRGRGGFLKVNQTKIQKNTATQQNPDIFVTPRKLTATA